MMDNWQSRAVRFTTDHNLTRPASVYVIDLMSELGEVAKELLLASDYGQRAPKYGPAMAAELGDVLYSLCLLADAVDVDLEEALTETLAKYEQRWRSQGSTGSEISGGGRAE